MPGVESLDSTDYAIFKALEEHETPLWKRGIHQYVMDNQEELPFFRSASLQTIGRRIDRMKLDNIVEANIIQAEEANRNMIIGYKLTDYGKSLLHEQRKRLIKKVVKNSLFPEEMDQSITQPELLELMQDEYGFDDEVRQQLCDYDLIELRTFLVLRHAQQDVVTILNGGHLSEYRRILEERRALAEALEIDIQEDVE